MRSSRFGLVPNVGQCPGISLGEGRITRHYGVFQDLSAEHFWLHCYGSSAHLVKALKASAVEVGAPVLCSIEDTYPE
jgi:hypothetical protein